MKTIKKSRFSAVVMNTIYLWIFLIAVLFSANVNAEVIKIMFQGDTQKIVNQAPSDFLLTMDNTLTDNVTNVAAFILHMGDITEDSFASNWDTAQTGFWKLDGHIPYVLNVGNNDLLNDPSADRFNEHFPLSRYQAWPSFFSNYDRHTNVAHHFNAGGVDWLVISLRVAPALDLRNWAENLIINNPDKKVILVSHDANPTSNVTVLGRKYENVAFVLAGHSGDAHELQTGDNGNKMGFVKTCHHSVDYDSYYCVAELDTSAGTAYFRYYSPQFGKYWDDPTAPFYPARPADSPWTWTGFDFGSTPPSYPEGASARGENPPNETADKAFDSNTGTKWLDFSPSYSWIQWRYTGGATAIVDEYAITSANDFPARDPMDWNLLGSNNEGETWDTLDSRTGVTFASRFERQNFFVSSPAAYNIYRLEITAVYDVGTANSVQLAEFELIEGSPDTDPPTPDPATFAVAPAADSDTAISMTATTASDPSGVEYYFIETSANPGGSDSGWQDSASYTDSGLNPETQYCYEIQARDKSANQNLTAWSTNECATTDPAAGVDRDWTNGGGDRLWSNSANWSGGVVPRSVDKAAIRNSGVGPIIDSSTTAVANQVVLSDWSSFGDTLDMTGGSLATSDWFVIGYQAANNGTFTMSAGTINVGTYLTVGNMGTGTLQMTGGTINVVTTFGIAQAAGGVGNVLLDGGTISCGSFSMLAGAAMDITVGTLIVDGDATSTINGYIGSGWITADGGAGTVDVDYDISNPGKTTVTATPDSYCGDETCDPGEDQCNCSDDCGTPPSTETTCDDGIDNDCDTYTDCDDSDCDSDPACPGCGNTICEPGIGEDQCNCPADCGTPPSTETTCDDGIDNDCDTYTDCADVDCDGDPACPGCGNTVCEPGIGEDQCNCPADCGTPPSTETICDDGIDNDCDTYTDSDDTDCQDWDPPTPDPMTWAVVPYATGTTSISMTATTATDPSGVQYYFTCTVGGGNDSGWQASPTYEDTGLSPETTYTYTVKARDLSVNLNETEVSSAESATTEALVGVDRNWTNSGGDRLWRNSANWSGGAVPGSLDKAAIRDDIVSGPIIDSSTTAVALNIVLGDWASVGDTLDITGGTLTTGGWFIIAYQAVNDGTLNVSGGTTSVGSHLDVGFMGAGHMNMTGGSVSVSGAFGIAMNGGSGDVYLDGGTISCGSFSMQTGATMDITDGTLIVNGDATSTINGYIGSGWITGYGGSGTLNVDYNVTNPGKTTVTADAGAGGVPDATHQAEDYTATSGCKVATNHPGYYGTGFVDMGGNGTWFELNNINGGTGGSCTLTFRYACKDSNNRQCEISVNGTPVGNVSFNPTGSWDVWSTDTIDVTLISGMNTIRVMANTGEGGPNIDQMEMTGAS